VIALSSSAIALPLRCDRSEGSEPGIRCRFDPRRRSSRPPRATAAGSDRHLDA
jgi:hypothetical protein